LRLEDSSEPRRIVAIIAFGLSATGKKVPQGPKLFSSGQTDEFTGRMALERAMCSTPEHSVAAYGNGSSEYERLNLTLGLEHSHTTTDSKGLIAERVQRMYGRGAHGYL
jgi:hypothetical protein